MIKVGRLPGRMYSVEYTEGITVGQAVASAKAQAEEAGRSLETVNCQVRVAGSEVSEGQVLTDNAVVTITQKIKGNSPVEVKIDNEEYFVENSITVKELLLLAEKDPNKYNLIAEFGFYANVPLNHNKSLSDCHCYFFSTVECEQNEEYDEDEVDYDEYACDDEEEYDEEIEEQHTCNCRNNIAVETIRPIRPNANTNFNYSNNGIEVYISVSNSNADIDVNKVLETSKVIYNYVKGVCDGL